MDRKTVRCLHVARGKDEHGAGRGGASFSFSVKITRPTVPGGQLGLTEDRSTRGRVEGAEMSAKRRSNNTATTPSTSNIWPGRGGTSGTRCSRRNASRQFAALAQGFPLRWPSQLERLFEFQGAVSTLGEALINPDCVTTSSSAAELFYMKQTGFAAMPFIAVFVAFIFWYAYGCVKKTPFFVKAPKRLSITSSARLAQMLHSKAQDAKKNASTTAAAAAADTAAKATAASSVIASVLASAPARSSRSKNANATHSSSSSSSTAPRGTKRRRLSAASRYLTTPKDKFVVSVTVVVYLIFPTLCQQAFRIFDCKTVAGEQYLAVDLEHPCYQGNHMMAVLTLGVSQLVLFVVGLPLLVLYFLRRNRNHKGGLNRHRVRVRYGLFFGA